MISMTVILMQLKDVNEKLYKKITLLNSINYQMFRKEFYNSKNKQIDITIKRDSYEDKDDIHYALDYINSEYYLTIKKRRFVKKYFNTFKEATTYMFNHMRKKKFIYFYNFQLL